jgi:putative DNA primase/helicase
LQIVRAMPQVDFSANSASLRRSLTIRQKRTDRPALAEEFRGHWRSILMTLGINSDFLRNRHGPCPICGGADRFRFDDKDGRGTYICNQCGAGDGPDLAMGALGISFKELAINLRARPALEALAGPTSAPGQGERRNRRNEHAAGALWQESSPVRFGSPVYSYLLNRVGRFTASPAMREHARCIQPGLPKQAHSAMVVLYSDIDGAPRAVQRTFVTPDGMGIPRQPKRMTLG